MEATFVERCPVEGALGRCVREAGTAMETQLLFYPPFTLETAKAMCGDPGAQLRAP
jgi:hypothetical protein